jgi:hypothetical protein
VDTNHRQDASGVKTHEEILALFRELKIIEERVKNLQLPEDELFDTDIMLQEVEVPRQPIETLEELQLEIPSENIRLNRQNTRDHVSLLKRQKKESHSGKRVKRIYFSKKGHPDNRTISTETDLQQHAEETGDEVKPVKSTFTLRFTEDCTLVGLDIKKPKPPNEKKGFLRLRRRNTEKGEQPKEVPEPGLKGKMKRLFSKIIPQKTKEGEPGGGIGGKIKGLFKRGSKQ